tara:strand:+ start:416 stop:622 length:207 start_codon:yes stop_codon:yes gene_type:complete
MNKDRILLEPLRGYIKSLISMEKDLATLEVKNNRSSVSRVKRTLLKIERDHHKPLKKAVDDIRKSIDK